jgi:hypothetical protein
MAPLAVCGILAKPFLRCALLFLVQTVDELDQSAERLLDGGAVFLPIVVGDDRLVLHLIVHPGGVARQHLGEFLFDNVADVLKRGRFASDPLSEFIAQLLKIDLTEVEGQPLGLVVSWRLRPDGFVDDPVQLLQTFVEVVLCRAKQFPSARRPLVCPPLANGVLI